ncbi:hypothetical protein F4820DRAFT_131488 [Hypoxylon rubiginosum]|uniref:Uncharacterized protein n=1 Tax=Hypoxylon rubiginosum TaxID=110542 RepID=A0ACB9YKK9_9PEZI|nr:hypothetical protein F4820DRAFT_131488 [Hypoxylon rubiginosum]
MHPLRFALGARALASGASSPNGTTQTLAGCNSSSSVFQSSASFLSNLTATTWPVDKDPMTTTVTVWPSGVGAPAPASQSPETQQKTVSSVMASPTEARPSTSSSGSSILPPPPPTSANSSTSTWAGSERKNTQTTSGSTVTSSTTSSIATSSEQSALPVASSDRPGQTPTTTYTTTATVSTTSTGTTIMTSPTTVTVSYPTTTATPPTTPPTGFITRTTAATTTATTTLQVGPLGKPAIGGFGTTRGGFF